MYLLLPITSIATTLLMVRFFLQMRAQLRESDSKTRFQPWLWLPWVGLVALVGAISWLLPWYVDLEIADPTAVTLAKVWSGIWPVLAGVVLFGGTGYLARRAEALPRLHLPAGDLIVIIEGALRRLPTWLPERGGSPFSWRRLVRLFQGRRPLLVRIENGLALWQTVGIVMMSLILIYLGLLSIQ